MGKGNGSTRSISNKSSEVIVAAPTEGVVKRFDKNAAEADIQESLNSVSDDIKRYAIKENGYRVQGYGVAKDEDIESGGILRTLIVPERRTRYGKEEISYFTITDAIGVPTNSKLDLVTIESITRSARFSSAKDAFKRVEYVKQKLNKINL